MNLRPTSAAKPAIDADEIVDLALAGARVHIDIIIPRTTIRARMRLVSRAEVSAIRAETRHYLHEHGFPVDIGNITALGALDEWNAEIAVRHLQVAVRATDDERELADIDSWRECDDNQIAELWRQYQDLEMRLDPMAVEEKLDEGDAVAIREAAKKKDAEALLSYGSRRLALFAITSTVPLPS